jgi:hypothetical protein
MQKSILKQAFCSAVAARSKLKNLTVNQKNQIEKHWDIEHAYYSSTLEGSKIDRKEFEELGNSEA